jgi:predicted ATPase
MKKTSPFYPGTVAPVSSFVGREKEVKSLSRLLARTAEGKSTCLFITGENGIGKTSFANFIASFAQQDNAVVAKDNKLCVALSHLGAVENLHDICKVMLQSVVSIYQEQRLLNKTRRKLAKYLDSLRFDLFGLRVEMKFKNDTTMQELPFEFSSLLYQFWKIIKKEYPHYKGLLIILDDIERACSLDSFPSFLKSLIDDICSHYQDFPLFLILLGGDEYREELRAHYPPIASIFQVMELAPLSEAESKNLLQKSFASIPMNYQEEALNMIVMHSGGFPLLLHEISDAVYWCDSDGVIDKKDVIDGLIMAANNLGNKQFRHLLYQRIRNPVYRKFLFQLAKLSPQTAITTVLLNKIFFRYKREKISSFIKRMVSLGVLQRTKGRTYQFSSQILRLYLILEYIKEA